MPWGWVLSTWGFTSEMDTGWVHPWVGLDWVGLGRIFEHM